MRRKGLVEVDQKKNLRSTSSRKPELPEFLHSIEDALKKLVSAMDQLEHPDLSKNEIARLRTLIQAVSVYQVKIAEYLDYRGIEAKLEELDKKYERLVREKAKKPAS